MRLLKSIMLACCIAIVCLTMIILRVTKAQTVEVQDIQSLMAKLSDEKATGGKGKVVNQILKMTSTNSEAREYVVHSLPPLIQSRTGEVWMIAVRLAGQMKATEAIPSLMEALSRKGVPAEPNISFGGMDRLDNDLVGKVLAQIGDPAIPSVGTLLKSPNTGTRRRGILILRNMKSPAARQALQDHISEETDEGLRKLINYSLELPRSE